jgi:ribosomal protein L32
MESELYVECCVCNDRKYGDLWLKENSEDYNHLGEAKISHTYCPPCFEDSMKEIKKEQGLEKLVEE